MLTDRYHNLTVTAIQAQKRRCDLTRGIRHVLYLSAREPQKKLTWRSSIAGSDRKPLTAVQWCDDTFAPKSKLRAIATALNQGHDPGDTVEWDDFIGRQAQILVKHYHNENGRTCARVKEVLRLATAPEDAEEKRAAAVTVKVKQAAAQSRGTATVTAPPAEEGAISDEDIPF